MPNQYYFSSGTSAIHWTGSEFITGLVLEQLIVVTPQNLCHRTQMVPDMALVWIWAMQYILFPHPSTRSLPLFVMIRFKNSAGLTVLWLSSPAEFPVISPFHLTNCRWSIHSLQYQFTVSAASLCPGVSKCPSAIDLSSPFSWDYTLCFSLTNTSLSVLICHRLILFYFYCCWCSWEACIPMEAIN